MAARRETGKRQAAAFCCISPSLCRSILRAGSAPTRPTPPASDSAMPCIAGCKWVADLRITIHSALSPA